MTVEFFSMTGPFAVIFEGEGAGAVLRGTPEAVFALLMADEGSGLANDFTHAEVRKWLQDGDSWRYDDDGNPYRWDFNFGEICSVVVVKIDPARATESESERCLAASSDTTNRD